MSNSNRSDHTYHEHDDAAGSCYGDVPPACHPGIRAMTDYWRSIHPADGLPGRRHFEPSDVPRLLSNVRLIDVVGRPPRFRVRLTGSRLDEFFGRNATGRWLDEMYPDFHRTSTYANYMRVVETRLPNWRRGQCELRRSNDCLLYERVQLPFASDGTNVDMILVCGVFGRRGEPLS